MADQTFEGWTNYATWNVALWADNGRAVNQAKTAWLEKLTKRGKTVTPQSARWFFRTYMGVKNTDLAGNKEEGTRYKDIDWTDLAEGWENDRKEIANYS